MNSPTASFNVTLAANAVGCVAAVNALNNNANNNTRHHGWAGV